METNQPFGRWVQQRRKALDLTQQELARRVGCALSMIQKIERTARQPSRQLAELLAHHLELDAGQRDAFLRLARRRPASASPTLTVIPPAQRPRYPLPSPLTSLVGRAWEVTTLCARLLEAHIRLLTITGPPGIGKTRLALRVAQTMIESSVEAGVDGAQAPFADGVCFVALAPIGDARFVIAAIAHALGVENSSGQPLLERVQERLSDRQVLLVLDNFEHLLPAAPLIVDLLEAAPALKVLATSRAPLQVYGEHEFVAPALTLPDLQRLPAPGRLREYAAVELFVQRVRAVQPEFTLDEANGVVAAELCVRLEGLPLAIELAAARSKLFSLPMLLAHLTGALAPRLDLLAGARYLPDRHRTLRNAIAWSYDLLTSTEQMVFRGLGVFAGGCPLAALAAVACCQLGLDPAQAPRHPDHWVEAAVRSLATHSLVQQQPDPDGDMRVTLLEMMRAYALEQLEQHGEVEAARRGHATWFLQLAQQHETAANDVQGNVVALVHQLERDLDNLRGALAWAAQHDLDLELQLVDAMVQFWSLRSQMSEGRQWLERCVPRLQSRLSSRQPAQLSQLTRLHFMLSFITWLQGDYALAQSRLEETIRLARQIQDWETMGSALQFLALTYYDRGVYATAHALALESVTLLRAFGTPWHLAIALTILGSSHLATGDQATAAALLEESLAIQQTIGNRWGVKLALLRLGDLYFAQGNDEQARSCLEDALQTFREEEQSWFVAQTLVYLGKVQWRNGARAAATGSWDESIVLARETGAKRYLAEALFLSGLAAQENGEQQQAKVRFTESLDLYQRIGNRIGAAYALSGLATLLEPPAQRARLLGAAATVLDTARLPLDHIERAYYEAALATVRGQLAEAPFAAAWEQGQAMTLEQAAALAQDVAR